MTDVTEGPTLIGAGRRARDVAAAGRGRGAAAVQRLRDGRRRLPVLFLSGRPVASVQPRPLHRRHPLAHRPPVV